MTYGWALLIIAVVLATIFQLGLFGTDFTPKANPGSCSVYRPYGPGTSKGIAISGACISQPPKFATSFNGVGNVLMQGIQIQNNITVALWIYMPSTTTVSDIVGEGGVSTGNWYMGVYDGLLHKPEFAVWASGAHKASCVTNVYTANKWYFLTLTYNSVSTVGYVNGAQVCSGAVGSPPQPLSEFTANSITVGTSIEDGNFIGTVANLQIYNTSLSATEVQGLYMEGIGGNPFLVQNLTGWWPLNANYQDYSGNKNNGQIQAGSGITFTSSWQNGYVQP